MKTVTFTAELADEVIDLLADEMLALAGDVEYCSCPEEAGAWTELLAEVAKIHASIAVARYSSPGNYVHVQMDAETHGLMTQAIDAQTQR